MTGRKVLFYYSNESPKETFYGSHQGVFHKWGTWDGKTVAIVEERATNQVHMTHPEFVRFAEPYGQKTTNKR
jgi:hypothetical protein